MENRQPPEGVIVSTNLQVHSIFHTIQGEGPFAGRPAVFVRLAGCNLQCPSCDTDYTSGRDLLTPKEVALQVHACAGSRTSLVVITGGEPFRQNLYALVETLQIRGFVVQIETNGTLFEKLPEGVFIVCSPKTGTINRVLVPYLNALKYVISADDVGEDGYPNHALGHGKSLLARPPKNFEGTIYMQPQDDQDPIKNQANLEAAVRACFQTGNTLCLQTHKLIGVA